jgi:hypothetical protein
MHSKGDAYRCGRARLLKLPRDPQDRVVRCGDGCGCRLECDTEAVLSPRILDVYAE